jgi:exodeoxyribonuclease-3
MKIISYNVNGLRAAIQKGLLEWLATEQPDVVCLQEIKIDHEALQAVVKTHHTALKEYSLHWNPAQKKGYSGTAVWVRGTEPDEVLVGCGHETYDAEGRLLRVRLRNGLQVGSLYLPSGTQGPERQAVKEAFMGYLHQWLPTQPGWNQHQVLVGDFNIAHQAIDIHDPVRCSKLSGFLPHERAWFSEFLELGLVDTFRALHPEARDAYSWWTFRGGAKERNKGWRIDYQLVPEALRPQLRSHRMVRELDFSDHVPLVLELDA